MFCALLESFITPSYFFCHVIFSVFFWQAEMVSLLPGNETAICQPPNKNLKLIILNESSYVLGICFGELRQDMLWY